jgi:hypothetical protein
MSTCADILSSHSLEGMSRCAFAKAFCDGDEGLLHYSSTYYCADNDGAKAMFLLSLLGWLALLFLLLGSTADDFFSPSLEQFTEKVRGERERERERERDGRGGKREGLICHYGDLASFSDHACLPACLIIHE